MNDYIYFIGDIMLGRVIGSKYSNNPYQIVSPDLINFEPDSFVVANLESPLPTNAVTDGDHLSFAGNKDILNDLKWVNLFSLANNHINDCGVLGMNETMQELDNRDIKYNGLFKSEYIPYILQIGDTKVAIITLTDMMNIPFDEKCEIDILRLGEERVNEIIKSYNEKGYFVIVYAHVGMLFTRFPNPITRNFLHEYIDNGADAIVTVHSHCLGGMEYYKNKPIFHSLGDFIMDGSSYRRRRSAILSLKIADYKVEEWKLIPAVINLNYETTIPADNIQKKMLDSFNYVSNKIEKNSSRYESFYKVQYKKELFRHILSTISFLYKTKGILKLLKILLIRLEEVFRMFNWMASDRSKVQRDDDAILKDRKKHNQDTLFE